MTVRRGRRPTASEPCPWPIAGGSTRPATGSRPPGAAASAPTSPLPRRRPGGPARAGSSASCWPSTWSTAAGGRAARRRRLPRAVPRVSPTSIDAAFAPDARPTERGRVARRRDDLDGDPPGPRRRPGRLAATRPRRCARPATRSIGELGRGGMGVVYRARQVGAQPDRRRSR